jgi:SAM-dependent methyltransferase
MFLDSLKHRILDTEIGYNVFSALVGAPRQRRTYIEKHVLPHLKTETALLDIGCGTGEILDYFPSTPKNYFGIDNNADYIAFAKTEYPQARFVLLDVDNLGEVTKISGHTQFDLVIMNGVVHHLDDATLKSLFAKLQGLMKANARLITIDGVFLASKQNPVAKYLLKRDRGLYVRRQEDYRKLFSEFFTVHVEKVYGDLLNIPYNHIVFEVGPRSLP